MSAIVFDTNVLLVANGLAAQMSDQCRLVCLARLQQARTSEAIVVDRRNLILREYHRQLDPNRRPPGPGDAFLRHLLQNMANTARVAQVNLTPLNSEQTDFAEFPADATLRDAFNPDDRKFVAASNVHPEKPPIVQAADSKWLACEAMLNANGIRLEMPCRTELEAIRSRRS